MLDEIKVVSKTAEEAVRIIKEMKKIHPEISFVEVRISKECTALNNTKAEIDYEELENKVSNDLLGTLEGLIDFRIRKAIR